jgi:SEC-C motif-containing protein
MSLNICPCNQEVDYATCCKPIHLRERLPQNALELMKARYSAFSKHQIDFLLDSHHSETKDVIDPDEISEWAKNAHWDHLEIIRHEVLAEDKELVEFKAKYRENGINQIHHEISQFKKEGPEWFYYAGEIVPHQEIKAQKLGRNDPCPCGSGKKFKKCCL